MKISFANHITQIRSGGWSVLIRKTQVIFCRLLVLISAFWAVPSVILVRLLKPWIRIRFGTIRNDRIGHFAHDLGVHYARRKIESLRATNLYWLSGYTCNTFWDKVARRNFMISPVVLCLDRWNRILPFGTSHCLSSSSNGGRDVEGLLEKSPSMLPFLQAEDLVAEEWLIKQGWQKGEPFVCFQVRDSKYLNSEQPGIKWDYHSYRDSDITTYVKAAEWLADQGVWVLRMGKVMTHPIPTTHPRIIDYAFHPERSDFLDTWLFAHCHLCVSTGTGPDNWSDIYRRPLLFINFLPLFYLYSWSNIVTVPKHLVWRQTYKPLTLREHLKHSYMETSQYNESGIDIIDLSSDEILLAVQEAWLALQDNWVESNGNAARQARFWQILRSDPQFDSLHGWIHPQSRVGDAWLEKQGDNFLV